MKQTTGEPLPKNVHMIAVCGTGMGALALLFREAGLPVTGSDVQAWPPMGDLLREAGVEIRSGYSAGNLPPDAEYVVVGNAISRGNPEVEEAERRGVRLESFPEALARFFLRGRRPVVVTGTHGKTTSTSLLSWLLESAGMSPGFLVGGEPLNFGTSSRVGSGPCFVVEGDEYDSAFFNKKPKFLHYLPEMALLTSLEYDHADIYPDFQSLKTAFEMFVRLLPAHGLLMVCDAYPEALEVAGGACCEVQTYGYGEGSDMRGRFTVDEDGGSVLSVVHRGEDLGSFRIPMAGRHNGLNVLGCLGVLRHLGVPRDLMEEGLESFRGVRRRQEIVAEAGGVIFMDDFAHHPTAVRETLEAVRARMPGKRVLAVFEPRTHTSRRSIFQEEYAEAFGPASLTFCLPVFKAENMDAGERFSPERLCRHIQSRGGEAFAVSGLVELETLLQNHIREGDLVLFMSTGSLSGLIKGTERTPGAQVVCQSDSVNQPCVPVRSVLS